MAEIKGKTVQECASEIKEQLKDAWIGKIYVEQIRSLRTRSFHLGVSEKENSVEVMHTLLGVEIKTGRKRITCPDLATARYLAVFARIGCGDVAVPYEINRISLIADALESSWHRMILLTASVAADRAATFQSRVRKTLVDELRREIRQAGAGQSIPQFNQNTKQRRS
jgi:hypothetical protein